MNNELQSALASFINMCESGVYNSIDKIPLAITQVAQYGFIASVAQAILLFFIMIVLLLVFRMFFKKGKEDDTYLLLAFLIFISFCLLALLMLVKIDDAIKCIYVPWLYAIKSIKGVM